VDHLNHIQIKILSRLLFKPRSRFRDLNTDFLTSDHFSYHIKSLVLGGFISKDTNFYSLTAKGKMLAGGIDTVTHTIEKQPKVSIVLVPHQNGKFLIQQRTKEPYFGYWGFIAGKVKFGETLQETAARELLEEAGLSGQFKFCYEIHEMVYDKTSGDQLEDKFFHIVEATGLSGTMRNSAEGENRFVTAAEFKKITPKYHNEQDLFDWFVNKDFGFKEEKYYIEKF
jgi:8-oxo-dGTP pyrophosphatase MutT (NUDIX family)